MSFDPPWHNLPAPLASPSWVMQLPDKLPDFALPLQDHVALARRELCASMSRCRIVYGDLNPQNIFIYPTGIVDFGYVEYTDPHFSLMNVPLYDVTVMRAVQNWSKPLIEKVKPARGWI